MLGLVFTELMGFIERHHSEEALDRVLDVVGLDHDGAYTAVGNYPHEEALSLVLTAGEVLGEDSNKMVVDFGRELFGRFKVLYPDFFADVDGALSFLERVEDHIHTEVKKLYTESQPPRLTTARDDEAMHVDYASHRPMALLAQGLIEGCIAEYGNTHEVSRIDDDQHQGRTARFHVHPIAV